MNTPIEYRTAPKQTTQADIVFCLDATASMTPCIEGVKRGLSHLVEGLHSAAAVDFRLRLIAYRDLHDPSCNVRGEFSEFTRDVDQFAKWLAQIKAHCGQEYRGAESTLDALYLALRSDWRFHGTSKAIILITDDDTHPSMHEMTCPDLEDNNVVRIVQDLIELDHSFLYLIAPEYPVYVRLQQLTTDPALREASNDGDQRVIARWLPTDDERYQKIADIQWEKFMHRIGKKVSATSITAAAHPDEPDLQEEVMIPNRTQWDKL